MAVILGGTTKCHENWIRDAKLFQTKNTQLITDSDYDFQHK